MTTTVATLIASKEAEDAQTTQYVASGVKAIIDKFTVTNTTGSPVTFAVNLVSPAGTPGLSNLILSKTIQAKQTYTCPEVVGHSLEVGEYISTIAGAVSSLTIRCTGREIS